MSWEQFTQTVAAEEEQRQPAKSEIPLTDNKFIYRNSSQTDVQSTWKRFGWKPVEQKYEYQR